MPSAANSDSDGVDDDAKAEEKCTVKENVETDECH